jgi:CRP-like cAMP-binding protein
MLAKMIENCRLRKEYGCNSLRPSVDSVLDKLRDFESTAGKDYFDAFKRIELRKNSYLLREGEVSTRIWFLEEGSARLFIYEKEKEITCDLFFSSEFIDLYDSSTLKTPSYVNIQLLTDSVLYTINWTRLEVIKKRYPVLAEIEKIIVVCYIKSYKKRIIEFQSLTSTERYLQLIKAYPYIIRQVSLTQIASYLGIKLETLSRIRTRVKSM